MGLCSIRLSVPEIDYLLSKMDPACSNAHPSVMEVYSFDLKAYDLSDTALIYVVLKGFQPGCTDKLSISRADRVHTI